MEERLQLLNDFWRQQEGIELITPYEVEGISFRGSIKLKAAPKDDLLFDVSVPLSYPFSNDTLSIRFLCTNVTGYRHMNADNSICIIIPKKIDFTERLSEEVVLLKEWRDKYYIQELEDDRYEYPILSETHNDTFLFTDLSKIFTPFEIGEFYALPHSNNSKLFKGISSEIFFIQRFGNVFCEWSDALKKQMNFFYGLYFFLDKEPVGNGRNAINNWTELNEMISQRGKELLYRIKTEKVGKKNKELFILLGYQIPNTNEVHWLALKVAPNKIPVNGKRIGPRNYIYDLHNEKIEWCKTHNASYDRFFGRGALTKKIIEKRILIIGAGAIGSSLAKILVRSGAKYIALSDMQSVEPGNICRSEFFLNSVSVPKTIAVTQQLYGISPFVNVTIEKIIDKCLFKPFMSETKQMLEQYDIIFDCTSDMELMYVLDKLKLSSEIFNISISNKAKELVCVAKSNVMSGEKNQLFSKLSLSEDKLIYEGTGCWSPTFEANYFDINCLLNLAVKNLNLQFEKVAFSSFVVSTDNINSSVNLKTIDY